MDEKISENMTVEEVAEKLERSQTWVRLGLQQGRFKFGSAVHNEEKDTWSYHISRASFWKYQYGFVPEILKKEI